MMFPVIYITIEGITDVDSSAQKKALNPLESLTVHVSQ